MADISFNCAECQQPLEAPAEMAGQMIECPACQKQIMIPDTKPQAVEPAASAGDGKCPSCGAKMDKDVVLCVQCGFHTKLGKKIATDFQ
jgi:DNA-directed RNA polymerase subunit RPC12/RpoP